MRSPSPALDASFNGKSCDLRILSTLHDAFHRIKMKFLLSEYVFKVPVVSVSKNHVQILVLSLQAHQPPSETDLHRFRQCPHVYPVPHMIWPMGSPSKRSEGQGYLSWLLLQRSLHTALSSRDRHCFSEVGAFHVTLSFQVLNTVLCHWPQVVTGRPRFWVPNLSLMVPSLPPLSNWSFCEEMLLF